MTESHRNGTAQQPDARLADITAVKAMQLVFVDGSDAWKKREPLGGYQLKVIAKPTQFFNDQDVVACRAMFKHQFSIELAGDHARLVNPYTLQFTVTPEELQHLKDCGLGKNNIGSLLTRDMKPQPRALRTNDPRMVLAENLRLQVVDPSAWRETFKVANGRTKNAEFFLPTEFIKQLAKQMPDEHSDEFHLKQAIRDAFSDLLPSVPVIIYCADNEQGTKVRLSVKYENCLKLDDAIMAVKQQPGTNVTSLELLRKQRITSTQSHGKY